MCADCTIDYERKLFAAIPVGGRFTGYVTGTNPRAFTTWPGDRLGTVYFVRRRPTNHPSIGRCVRETVYVVDDEHRHWSGTRFDGYATAGDVITLTRRD